MVLHLLTIRLDLMLLKMVFQKHPLRKVVYLISLDCWASLIILINHQVFVYDEIGVVRRDHAIEDRMKLSQRKAGY